MGVDISTYCCRIGTFRHGPGLDVVLLREDVNYGGSMRAVGAVAFIGILLIMAGVEANPGPLSKSSTADGAEQIGYRFAGASATGQQTRTSTEVHQCLPIDPETTDGNSILQHIKKFGMNNIQHVLTKSLDEWNNKSLNIAVTGESGAGKSSLINSLRSIDSDHSNAAAVGFGVETTNRCTPYLFQSQKNVVLWDLPGVGTPEFKKDTYLHGVEFERYDFFLICFEMRCTDIVKWLAEQIKKRRKSFYFVRTKIDIDMYNARRRFGPRFHEETQIKSIRSDCLKQLLPDSKIYLISNAERSQYDFPSLLTDLINSISSEKKAALTLSIFVFSDEILREKEIILRNRMWKVALASGVGAVIPIPGLSVMFDVGIILKEILFYREQFGLDDESLSKTADAAGIDVKTLKLAANLKTAESVFTSTGLLSFMSSYAAREVTEKLIQWIVPVIGTAIGCGISYTTTMTILKILLKMMRDDAKSVLQYVFRKHSSV